MLWRNRSNRTPNPTPEEFADWLTPAQAFGHLPGGRITSALASGLSNRLRDGLIYAAAEKAVAREGDDTVRLRYQSIDQAEWTSAVGLESTSNLLWSTGDVQVSFYDTWLNSTVSVNFYSVRFEWQGMFDSIPDLRSALFPPPSDQSTFIVRTERAGTTPAREVSSAPTPIKPVGGHTRPVSPPRREMTALERYGYQGEPTGIGPAKGGRKPGKHAGGRPSNPLFEEAINAVWAELYDNKLQPKLQKDVAARIADWFSENGHDEPGSTQIAQRARMIWQSWFQGDE